MSFSELQRITVDAEKDSALRDRLRAAGTGGSEARIAAARSAGYEIDKSDIEALNGTMSDADLDTVSGGGWNLAGKIKAGWNYIWH